MQRQGRAWRRLAMLLALCAGALLASVTGIGISPFLLDIARDLSVDLTAAGNLVALQSVTWGVASLFAGAASDRLGRRPILTFGLLVIGISGVGVVLSTDYIPIALWRALSGVGGGAFMGTAFATVSDQFPPAERGRSLGWVMMGQSLALVLGVPAVTLLGAAFGWRGSILVQALVLFAVATAVWLTVPPLSAGARQTAPSMRATLRLLGPRVLALFGASCAERVCYATVVVFMPTFLLVQYGIDAAALAVGLLVVALGNLIGNVIGGQLSDRVRTPQAVIVASLAATAVLAIPVLMWSPAAVISIGLGFLYTFANAAGKPALLTSLSQVSEEARGAVLGLNITVASIGWLSATALGGYIVSTAGFGGLALITSALAAFGTLLAVVYWLWRPAKRPALVVARGEP
jgi:DHA1 family inner membrane transport protein